MIKKKSTTACDEITRRRKAMKWDTVRSLVNNVIVSYNRKKGFLISDEDIEDAVQNACLNIFEHIGEYDKTKSKLATWMSKIAANCFYDELRQTKKKDDLFTKNAHQERIDDDEVLDSLNDSLENSTHGENSGEELEHLLSLVLRPLCENYRTAIRCIYEGTPSEEMAEYLACSKNNVRPTISRARKAARKSCMSLGLL